MTSKYSTIDVKTEKKERENITLNTFRIYTTLYHIYQFFIL